MNVQPTGLWKNSLWARSSYEGFLNPLLAAPGAPTSAVVAGALPTATGPGLQLSL